MMLPVSGSRSGAPGGSVSSSTPPRVPTKAMAAHRSPRESCSGVTPSKVSGWSRSSVPGRGEGRVVGAEPGLDEALTHEGEHDRQHDRRRDAEVQVGRDVDRPSRFHQPDGLVGDLGEHGVGGRDEQVDAEPAGHAGEGRRHAGERIAADAVERSCAERDQHQVAGVRGDARDHAEADDEVGQCARRGDGDQLADQRGNEPRHLRNPHTDHHDEDDPHGREGHEVLHERGEQETDPIGREQALDLGGLGHDLVGLGVGLLTGDQLGGQDRSADVDLLHDLDRRFDHLVGRAPVRPGQKLRQDDQAGAETEEQHRGMRHLVADPLDDSEDTLQRALLGVECDVTHLMVSLRVVRGHGPSGEPKYASRRRRTVTVVVELPVELRRHRLTRRSDACRQPPDPGPSSSSRSRATMFAVIG